MRTIAVTLIATEMVLLTSMTVFGDSTKPISIQPLDPNETVSDAFKNSADSSCVIIRQPPQTGTPQKVCNWLIEPDAINHLLQSQPK